MTNLSTLSTSALLTRLQTLETAARYNGARHVSSERLEAEWRATRDELDSRPTCEVLAAL